MKIFQSLSILLLSSRTVKRHLQFGSQQSKRSSDLMGCVAGECAYAREGLLDSLEHLIQRL